MNSCVFIPLINVNGLMLDSKLWQELISYTNDDRNAAKVMYAVLNGDKVKNIEGIEFNDLGLVTLESAKKHLPLQKFLSPKRQLAEKKRELAATDSAGHYITYTYVGDIADKVEEFNKNNPGYVATIKTRGRLSTIDVDLADDNVEYIKQDYAFKNQLCKNILNFLISKGFTMSFLPDNLPYAGLFSPDAIDETVDGLRNIISIAKGERGEKALVEEFGHLLIYGLNHTPIVKRLIANLENNENAVRQILGDKYALYEKMYSTNNSVNYTKLAYEAAGKLMYEEFQKQLAKNSPLVSSQFVNTEESESINGNSPINNFINRIYNFIKGVFSKFKLEEISTAVNDARLYAGKIVAEFQHNPKNIEAAFLEKNLVNANTLYDIDLEISALYKEAKRGVDLITRKYRMEKFENIALTKGLEEALMRYKEVKVAEESLKQNNAIEAICNTLSAIIRLVEGLLDRLNIIYNNVSLDPTNYDNITSFSVFLNDIKSTIEGYSPYVSACLTLDTILDEDSVKIDPAKIASIKDTASKIAQLMGELNNYKNKHARQNLKNLFRPYFLDFIIDIGKDKGKLLTLDMILDYAEQDSNFIDRYIRGMSLARDPILNIANALAESEIAKTNLRLVPVESLIRNMSKELEESGQSNSFIYERNSEGKLTGRLISEYNWDRFAEEEKKAKESFSKEGLRGKEFRRAMDLWKELNTKPIVVSGRTYTVPNTEYKVNGERIYYKPLIFDNDALEKYYNLYIALKAAAESMLTDADGSLNLYNAVQQRKDKYQRNLDYFRKGDRIELFKDNMAAEYKTLVDDKEYRLRTALTDFSGRPLKEVPMYYVDLLENPEELLTDSASALIAYTAMAANYKTMKNLLNNFLLLQDYVENTRETKTGFIEETTPEGKQKVELRGVIKNSNTAAILDNFIETTFLGNKKDIETFHIGKWSVNLGKIADKILAYNSKAKIALNTRVDIANRVAGVMNLWFEAFSGEYFNRELFKLGGKEYYKLLPGYTANIWDATKDDFLSLLIKKYDMMEDYEESLERAGIRYGKVSRMAGVSAYVGQRIGELGNHVPSGIAILLNTKVKNKEGEIIDLYHTLKPYLYTLENGSTYYDLLPEEGTTDLLGNLLVVDKKETEALTALNATTTNIIHSVNQSINGAFKTINRGAINRKWVGRAAILFRLWMINYYDTRYGSGYYDARTKRWRESTYGTGLKLCLGELSKAWKKFEFLNLWKLNDLNERERALVKKFYAEAAGFFLTGLLVSTLAALYMEKDENGKHRWKGRQGYNMFEAPEMFIYALNRMFFMQALIAHRDIGAEFPSAGVFDNINSIFQSIFPSLKAFADALNLINPFLINETLDHSNEPLGFMMLDNKLLWTYEKFMIPYIESVNKTLRIVEGDSMKDFLAYIVNESDLDFW